MPPTGQRQTMLFSATFPKEIQRLAAGERQQQSGIEGRLLLSCIGSLDGSDAWGAAAARCTAAVPVSKRWALTASSCVPAWAVPGMAAG